MTTFAALKKSSNHLDRLAKELEKINNPTTEKKQDERFWQPEVDKSGNGVAVIRFLPSPAVDGDDALPWVRLWNHGFKGPSGKWYIENSLTTINQKDPVSEYNTVLWNSSSDDNSPARKQAREQKRKLTYISNILVISDPKHPENEGKVFLYKYGKKIFDKISILMNPEFEGDEAVNPFDLWNGANFRLKIRTVEGYRNYDQSNFATPSALSDDDSHLEKIWKSEYSLKEFIDPKNFKSYEDLKRKLEEVLELNEPVISHTKAPSAEVMSKTPVKTQSSVVDDDDEDLAAFKALAD
jgi:hypothetical protein